MKVCSRLCGDFLAGRETPKETQVFSSFQRGAIWANLDQLLPGSVLTAIRQGLPIMNASWKGDFLRNATLSGPEMRGSSPVRMERDRQSFQSPVNRLLKGPAAGAKP